MSNRQRDEKRIRVLLAQECARLMADEGIKDFLVAKRKAATRLGVSNRSLLPSNIEIEQALREYQRLFRSQDQPAELRMLRKAAVKAMEFFAHFRPRLVGPVLAGTADSHSNINLHLFAETTEELVLFLLEHEIPFETFERRLRMGNGEWVYFSAYRFCAGEVVIELTVFPLRAARQAPLSPVDGRPMPRADLDAVRGLLDDVPPA